MEKKRSRKWTLISSNSIKNVNFKISHGPVFTAENNFFFFSKKDDHILQLAVAFVYVESKHTHNNKYRRNHAMVTTHLIKARQKTFYIFL